MPLNLNLNLGSLMHRTGSAPSPFDAINGPRLAGPQGSHPLHSVAVEELVSTHLTGLMVETAGTEEVPYK